MSPLDPALTAALTRLATVRRLLVTSDYDGVLAPIVADPMQAFPLPAAMTALRGLAALPDTPVTLVSGRAREELAMLAEPPPEIRLVGSHGAELADAITLTPTQAALHERLVTALRELAAGRPGVRVEVKPASVVLHTRTAAPDLGAAASRAVFAGPGSWPGVHLTTGKEVVELAVLAITKGDALSALREQAAADAMLFLGDDVTDEHGFAVLRPDDVGIKVGPGRTLAEFRVPDPPAAAEALALLLTQRADRPHRTGPR